MTVRTTMARAALAWVALAAAGLAQEAPSLTAIDGERPHRILFVGNSYLYYGNGVHRHVAAMAREAYPGEAFHFRLATISDATLADHALETYLAPGRLDRGTPFDTILLQGHSRGAIGQTRDRFATAIADHAATIAAYGARTLLYMTPAYVDRAGRLDRAMMDRVAAGYTAAGNAAGALVIPVGRAFQMAYAARPDLALHQEYDGVHPSDLGTFLAAATIYAALYDRPATALSYDYHGRVPAEAARVLRRIAEDATEAYYGR